MRWPVALVFLLGFGRLAAGAERPAGEAPSPEQVRAWIGELGDARFAVREQAQQQLLAAGPAAEAALKQAAGQTADAEVQSRALQVLRILAARPRLEAALRQLDTDDPDKLAAAVDALCAEFGQGSGAEEAVARAAQASPTFALWV